MLALFMGGGVLQPVGVSYAFGLLSIHKGPKLANDLLSNKLELPPPRRQPPSLTSVLLGWKRKEALERQPASSGSFFVLAKPLGCVTSVSIFWSRVTWGVTAGEGLPSVTCLPTMLPALSFLPEVREAVLAKAPDI